jgi:cyclohexadieny/prephenate dehydrogenase
MDAKNHDSIMAITSHIPHLIAYNIVGTANDLGESIKSEVIKFSASGFRDFTRIASSDPTMWRDIMLSNKDEILSLLSKFNDDLKGLIEAIKSGDGDYLFERFKKTKNIRQKILEEDKNKS